MTAGNWGWGGREGLTGRADADAVPRRRQHTPRTGERGRTQVEHAVAHA